MKKKDMMIIAAVLILAGIMALFINYGQETSGETVRIMIDGKEYGKYSLMSEQVIEVVNEFGVNKITIKDGQVFMKEADCPDQYCVKHRTISKTNETIVCLPHKLVVEVLAQGDTGDIDSVAQ